LIPIDASLARIRWDPTFGHDNLDMRYWYRIRQVLRDGRVIRERPPASSRPD
jgi:hypothetical protein